MSTPEKPRPSLDDTLTRIDQTLAEVGRPATAAEAREYVLGMYGLRDTHEFVEVQTSAVPGHRRSCQHDGPPGPTCPGCTEIDELLAIAHSNAAPIPSAAERALRTVAEASAELLGRERPPIPPPAVVDPDRGWLTRTLHRLFGDGGP